MDRTDPIFRKSDLSLTFFPVENEDLFELYNKCKKSFWIPENVPGLGSDRSDWDEKMTEDERYTAKIILAFFNIADQLVDDNLRKNFTSLVELKEAKAFYDFQQMMEQIHSEAYSLMIDSYIRDSEEKMRLFRGLENFKCLKGKGDWIEKWINADVGYAERLVAFACVEGVFFSSAFAFMVWLGSRNILRSAVTMNEYIRRDEGFHTEFACLVYRRYIVNKPEEETVRKIVREAVSVEKEFISEAMPVDLALGMNKRTMWEYIEFVADCLLMDLGYDEEYGVKLPFEFMKKASSWSKANFFEVHPTSYRVSDVKGEKIDITGLSDDLDF